MKKIVIMGVGNLLLSDEGIGVHAVQELSKRNYPDNIEVYDGGTLGLLSGPLFENRDLLVVIDSVEAEGEPGDVITYSKDEIMYSSIPLKLSPHQIGVQETLLISELRGECPEDVIFIGVIPDSYSSSTELTETGKNALKKVLAEVDKILAPYL
ncbi:MAG: HyaD/HybD family hydrogenase maturation endopeptidase [Deferribacteraceae bacterium]|jgi:hydrogenase maturation protease|nr:HyaD/HybD family hydrogenase maturation endopeptidase [Deferribacteraceae bacterium]